MLLPADEGGGGWGAEGCIRGKWEWETWTGKSFLFAFLAQNMKFVS